MKKLLLSLFILFTLSSCGDLLDDIEEAISSSFSATVSGDVNSSFSGEANFVHIKLESQTPQSSGLVVELENAENADEVINLTVNITGNADGVPAGTYNYDINNTDVIIGIVYDDGQNGYIYPDLTKTNQIILTSVEGTKVKGSFTFNIANSVSLNSEFITVSGTFDALGITSTQ